MAHIPGRFHIVLDVGCGTGTLLKRLMARYAKAEGIGIDANGTMLLQARRKLGGTSVRLYLADACRIPLPDRSVDLLTLASVLHYLPSPSITLLEARRVLKPEGVAAMVDYVPHTGTGSILDGLIRLYDPGHVRCRGIQELSRLTTRSGFTITHARRFPINHVLDGVVIRAQAPIMRRGGVILP